MYCINCGSKFAEGLELKPEKVRKTRANKELESLNSHPQPTMGEGIEAIREVLTRNGFTLPEMDWKSLEADNPAMGATGERISARYHEQVGPRTYISVSIFRYGSGNYEFNVYLS
jgi:hypothetical protein